MKSPLLITAATLALTGHMSWKTEMTTARATSRIAKRLAVGWTWAL
ncbi:hypothetical protein YS110_00155 [Acidovorax sp. YS12]|nr:hypothetical protein YS110_00155 [Acidovorax sp. YS12]